MQNKDSTEPEPFSQPTASQSAGTSRILLPVQRKTASLLNSRQSRSGYGHLSTCDGKKATEAGNPRNRPRARYPGFRADECQCFPHSTRSEEGAFRAAGRPAANRTGPRWVERSRSSDGPHRPEFHFREVASGELRAPALGHFGGNGSSGLAHHRPYSFGHSAIAAYSPASQTFADCRRACERPCCTRTGA